MSRTQATFREAVAVSEFRALWAAQMLSIVGDHLARIALSVLVFHRTGSPLLTAAIYALSFLPWVLGGPLLAGLADRFPRRTVMVQSDVGRAALVALMVIPHTPILVLAGLLFCTELLASPFSAARAAILPDVLPGDTYVIGSAISNITLEMGQVVGLGVGGAIVAIVGTRGALGADAATFVFSAVVIWLGVRHRSIVREAASRPESMLEGTVAGARLLFGEPRLRALVCLAWLCAFYVVPEGLAVPYAASLGGGAAAAGLLLAANPAGTILGAAMVSRLFAPARRLELMGALAVLSCLPLLGFIAKPGLLWATALLVLSGVGSAYNLPANAAFVAALPAARRGQAFGLVQSGMYVFQGAALFAGGALAEWFSPPAVIAAVGLLGVALAAVLATTVLRPDRLTPRASPAPGS
ncbi:MAG: MFS transporter [Pseudonocardiales bacterium]